MERDSYRSVATSLAGFIQQLSRYVSAGYVFYSTSSIPPRKLQNVERIDAKLLRKYDIDISDWARRQRKRQGIAVFQYLRCENFFVILCTTGYRELFNEGEGTICDVRRKPLRFAGYSVRAYRKDNGYLGTTVRIEEKTFQMIKEQFVKQTTHRSVAELRSALYALPFEPYAPVRRQMLQIVKAINDVRNRASKEQLPYTCIRMKRKQVKPFKTITNSDKIKAA